MNIRTICAAPALFLLGQRLRKSLKLANFHINTFKKVYGYGFPGKEIPEENQETVLAEKNGQTEKWAEQA